MAGQVEEIRKLDLAITDGASQLAMTEAIMNAVAAGRSPPTVRLYSWAEPVVILGVGQPASDLDLDASERLGHRVLRRIGGGTAVYHDHDEVSIDLIIPAGHALAPSDVHQGYQMFSGFLKSALESLGVQVDPLTVEGARQAGLEPEMRPLCFASFSPYEFVSDGKKLNGLCQIRRRDVITYQSAIYRHFPIEPLLSSLQHDSPEIRDLRANRLARSVTDLATLAGESIEYDRLQHAVIGAIEMTLGLSVVSGNLSEWETEETERLIVEKYANPGWTFRR